MALTEKQRAQVSRMRFKGYVDGEIARILGVTLSEVSTVRRGGGRPRRPDELTAGERNAHQAIKVALKDKTDGILAGVRCVLANYGPLLGLTIADAEAVIEKHRAKKTA